MAKAKGVNNSTIFNGTILIYFCNPSDQTYQIEYNAVKEVKDLE